MEQNKRKGGGMEKGQKSRGLSALQCESNKRFFARFLPGVYTQQPIRCIYHKGPCRRYHVKKQKTVPGMGHLCLLKDVIKAHKKHWQ